MNAKRIIAICAIGLFAAAFVVIGVPMIDYIVREGIKDQKIRDLRETALAEGRQIQVRVIPWEEPLPLPDKISATRWIIEGRILSATAEEVQKNPISTMVYTVYEVEVMKVLRGDVEKRTVSVAVLGGETESYLISYDRHDVLPGEHFIMFLSPGGACELDTLSDFGVIAPGAGLYLIEDGIAESFLEGESLPEDDLRGEIAGFADKPRTEILGTSSECLYPPPRWSR